MVQRRLAIRWAGRQCQSDFHCDGGVGTTRLRRSLGTFGALESLLAAIYNAVESGERHGLGAGRHLHHRLNESCGPIELADASKTSYRWRLVSPGRWP